MGIRIYTKTSCHKCAAVKKKIEGLDIQFEELNIEQLAEAKEYVVSRGHKTVPQVYFNDTLLGNSEITTEALLSVGE